MTAVTDVIEYQPPKVGKYGGGVFMATLTLTICYIALNILCIYWILSNINISNYVWEFGVFVIEYFRNGGPIRGYRCVGGSTEEEIICQIKAGVYKFYRAMFLNHLLIYVATLFDTKNFFSMGASLWLAFNVSTGLLSRAFTFISNIIIPVVYPIKKFIVWYTQVVFVNIEELIGRFL